jgi:hypothetical protein
MPSRKVRRRRAKLQRHEYEYVVQTEEGEEVPIERPAERERSPEARAARGGVPLDRRGRPITQPSWQRSFRRTAIFAPFIFLFVYLDPLGGGRETTPVEAILSTLFILAFFLPFSYFVDRLIYSGLMRRHERARTERR